MSKIHKIHSILHRIKCIVVMACAYNSDTNISEASHKNFIQDGYCASNNVNYIPLMLGWEMHLLEITSRFCIWLHIIQSYPLFPKPDIWRKLFLGDSLVSNKLSPRVIPHIIRVLSTPSTIATLLYPEGISKSEFIDARTSQISKLQVVHTPVQIYGPPDAMHCGFTIDRFTERTAVLTLYGSTVMQMQL